MRIVLVILTVTLLSSCSAQWHLKRAIKKDPTIISTLDTKVKIDTVLYRDTVVVVKATHDTIVANIDSIINEYKLKNQATVVETDRLRVELQNIKGKPKFVIVNKEIKVPVRDTVRLSFTKTVPAKLVHDRIYVKGFFWWTGLIITIALAIFTIIFLILKSSGIISFFKSLRS